MPSRVEPVAHLVLDVVRRRAEHHVAEHRRRDEHALGRCRRNGQDGPTEQRAGELVEDDQLASPRRHGERVVAERAMQFVRPQPGRVDEESSLHLAGRDPQEMALAGGLDGEHRAGSAELDAVADGFDGERHRGRPRIDDVLVGHQEPAHSTHAEVGSRSKTVAESTIVVPVYPLATALAARAGAARPGPRPRRPARHPWARRRCPLRRRGRGGARSRGRPAGLRPFRAGRRTPCGGWPRWPCCSGPTSAAASISTTRSRWCDRRRATAAPTTPAPTMATSYVGPTGPPPIRSQAQCGLGRGPPRLEALLGQVGVDPRLDDRGGLPVGHRGPWSRPPDRPSRAKAATPSAVAWGDG